jgi:predicted house-cleaning NTP pyrophosphatase (Maf/HAM1 superfamily)
MQNKTVSILSIDAWRDPQGWSWNNWYKVGTCDVSICDLSVREILRYMRSEGYLSATSAGKVAIDDDQYNVVIVNKNTREPLFAIAYGELQ